MKYNNKKLALVLFVLSTTLILGSAIDAYAADPDGRGETGDGDIEACLNRPGLPNFPPCDNTDEWNGGNITFDATYKEGGSIPVRIDITDLEVNENVSYQKLIIGWHITKTQGGIIKHTFDYITSFDRNDNPHPCLVPVTVGGPCEGFFSDSIDIPPPTVNTIDGTTGDLQPITSFNLLKDIGETKFWMYSPEGTFVDITSIGYVSQGDPSFSGSNTESTQLFVEYTTDSTNVIAVFGAHISSPDDWDFHAVDVNGKSFQIECVEVKANGGCDGGQINLDASHIIEPLNAPELKLVKNIDDSNGGGAGAGEWMLSANDGSNNGLSFTALGNSDTFFIVEVDTPYALSEDDGPGDYTATNGDQFSCSINEGTPFDTNTITLQVNEKAVCTITNIFDTHS